MKIIVMRHGKPVFDLDALKNKRISSNSLSLIIDQYESTNVDDSDRPHDEALQIAQTCRAALSSDLPRAITSIKLLGLEDINTIDKCFRESPFPYLNWNKPRLSFFTWAIIFRLMWLAGFSKNGESFRAAKIRAQPGAKKLINLANKHGTVLLLGHGIMNRLVIKALKENRWVVTQHTGKKYWSYTVLELKN
ncbi:MAG: histidine phosphatase family protein [Gammaproteobacteria bacterium]|nr:histidine phosphatase family protein [Gammaproteobacteria bacterium]